MVLSSGVTAPAGCTARGHFVSSIILHSQGNRVPYLNTTRISDAPLLGNEWGDSEEVDVSELIELLDDTFGNS